MSRLSRLIEEGGGRKKFDFSDGGGVTWDFTQLARQTDKTINKVLFQTGAACRNIMRKELSKPARQFNEPRPWPFAGNADGAPVRDTFKEWRRRRHKHYGSGAGRRPPRQRVGTLRNLVTFNVDQARTRVTCGPDPIAQKRTKYTRGIPLLLDQGGRASSNMMMAMGQRQFVSVRYRAFPYAMRTLKKSEAHVDRILANQGLQ